MNITAAAGLAYFEELPEEVKNLIEKLHQAAFLMADTAAGFAVFAVVNYSAAILTLAVFVKLAVTCSRNFCLAYYCTAV